MPGRRGLATLLLLTALPAAAEYCSRSSVGVRDVRLFEACYCETHDYAELGRVVERHGLRLDRDGTDHAWSERIGGRELFYCSVDLRWQDEARRENPDFCGDDYRRRVVEDVRTALRHPVAINSTFLTCR